MTDKPEPSVRVSPSQYAKIQEECLNLHRVSYENAKAALKAAGLTDAEIADAHFRETKIVVEFGRD